jgi:hypothetical protein
MNLDQVKDTPLNESNLTVGELYEIIKKQLSEDAADDLVSSVMGNHAQVS